MKHLACIAVSLLAVVGASPAVAPSPDELLDPELKQYEPVQGVAGSLKSVGSDTMNNLMTFWAEQLQKHYPGVSIEVTGKGSSTAPPALTEGQASFGPMSRQMKSKEIDAFESEWGYKPTLLRTGIDCLAVFVHKDCPLDEITVDKVRMVFSVDGPDMTWGDLGVEDPAYKFQRVVLYGRNSASGTYGYFKQQALGDADYKSSVKEQPGSSSVVQAVGADRFSMGYSGLGFRTQEVKVLPIVDEFGDRIEPKAETAFDGSYPYARFLYVYINKDPNRALDPLREQFIRLIFSRDGQEAVLKDGYFPINAAIARQQLEELGLEAHF
ncbi:MAG: phosphate ABC transporter substrate-binding protein [Planctomycetota bacterium]